MSLGRLGSFLVFLVLAASIIAFLPSDSEEVDSARREWIQLEATRRLDDWVAATNPDQLVAELTHQFGSTPPDPQGCTSLRASLATTRATLQSAPDVGYTNAVRRQFAVMNYWMEGCEQAGPTIGETFAKVGSSLKVFRTTTSVHLAYPNPFVLPDRRDDKQIVEDFRKAAASIGTN